MSAEISSHDHAAFATALLDGRFLINVNNFVAWPARTGIQRVCYEFCTRWPHLDNTVPFVEMGPDKIGILTPDIFDDIRNLFEHDDDILQLVQEAKPDLKMEPNVGWLGLISARNRIAFEVDAGVALDACRAVICLEESLNLEFFSFAAGYRPEKIFNLCHDFLVWTHAQHFDVKWDHADNILLSLENRRRYRNNFFTSTSMRDQYVSRINRGDERAYYVIPPGADGLGRAYRQQVPDTDEFVVVGTLEPRKQPIQILEAFERLNANGRVASLCFAGRMGWLAAEDKRRLLKAFETYPWLRWVDGPHDDVLRSLVQNSRATIYLSLAEGFGSPPVESVALGVPCIVSAVIPSVLDIPGNGQIRIDPEDTDALLSAVRRLLDDASVMDLQKEIETLPLPRWQSFVDGISSMVDERAPLRDAPPRLSYAQALDVLRALTQIREVSRDAVIDAVLRATTADISDIEIAQIQDEAKSAAWTNVEVVLNLAARLPHGAMPAAFVVSALKSTLDVSGLRPNNWVELQSWFQSLIREPDYRLYLKRIFLEIHGRGTGDEELESHLPANEATETRLHHLLNALSSTEYADQQESAVLELAPEGYFDRVEVRSVRWSKAALASLANEAAVDRALLIEDDSEFVNIASLDLSAQTPSREQASLWISWSADLRGRYRVLLDILTTRACLLKVSDPRIHLELIHHVARRAGLGSRNKMSALDLAVHAARSLQSAAPLHSDLGVLIGNEDLGRDCGIGRLVANQSERANAVAIATIWAMASGRAEWDEALLSWASAKLRRSSSDNAHLRAPLGASSAEHFRAIFGRSASPEQLSVLAEKGSQRGSPVVQLAILIAGLRRGAVTDIAEALRTLSRECAVLIANADEVENLSAALEAAEPLRFGQIFRSVESAGRQPDTVISSASPVQPQIHTDGDIGSLDGLMALDGEYFVRAAYKKILMREADAGGLATYVAALASGKGKAEVVRSLALSEEGRLKDSQLLGLERFLDSDLGRKKRRKKGIGRLLRWKLRRT